ncbi:MAG: FadR family transcriptional regulator [Clostridium sp.]|nr:FadR family transcriptional regulator [Clostridium sp.]
MNRLNVTNQIVQYFKDNIILGNWKVGERIPSEKQLTDSLGVSRASVRTAVQQLVGIGVLNTVHGKGTYLITDNLDDVLRSEIVVSPEDCGDILKIMEFRRIVEPDACFMAVTRMPSDLLQNLERLYQAMEQHKEDKERFVTTDIAFHKEICKASANPLVEKIMNQIFDEYRRNHDQVNRLHGYGDGLHYHKLILEAVRERDAGKAGEIMFEHLQHTIDRIESEQQPERNKNGCKDSKYKSNLHCSRGN